MLKKYPRLDAIFQKAGAEVGTWLCAAVAFSIFIWLVRIFCEWLNLAV